VAAKTVPIDNKKTHSSKAAKTTPLKHLEMSIVLSIFIFFLVFHIPNIIPINERFINHKNGVNASTKAKSG